tara:strand:+ start:23 stop:487 length:465 start_codon:yes stop_codon:yes gene_type:complete
MLEIVDALRSDAIELAPHLRPIDKLEVEATGKTPEESLTNSFNLPKARVYSAVDSDRNVVLMYGVSQCPNNPKNGVIWMLTSELAQEHKKSILKLSKPKLKDLCTGFSNVYNLIHKDNKSSIRWLEWCGFEVLKNRVYKLGGEDFYLLIKRNEQ